MLTPVNREQELKHETLELLKEYRESESRSIRDRVVHLNFGLVRKEAHHWVNQCNESYEDLIQVGCIGLIRAIERFDTTKGTAFSSFAIPYIRGEIQHYLRDRGSSVRIPRRWLALRQQSVAKIQELRLKLNRQPTDAEVAEILQVSVAEWQEIKLADQNREPLSLDTPVNDTEEGTTCLGELVADPRYRSFQLAQEDKIRLQQALANLENRTREILEFVFLHDLTQKEVAELLNISVVTVSRRVKKGLEAMKKLMIGTDS
ncbi:MAG TPA: RNA polymerase subunit sigma [Cyanobacteria bacterium UBA11149]|nr:RNA polymerase subunit sigma [Cyanobacteria bacterium UBA11367]HBE56461.1 RNA polymerase subunit sigma [Cyanobacteria bacterium UBA11366]HBK64343.1 RNA polymerase subunit sigma [Cyanobacteria bacterium UBA11166]HBR73678.1 RNA polymerase subunit sigma [Cyanobacteria bacterium UBA11159]HBS71451.1 RNA polymerase subunit sigma [Cyanobacteria bacterium UBA11153]HBW91668.1 RNA polymerase subunit sigma [Cyanobacteria bacterium UBA11149]HCA93257.1 RNA polymerase subunit sigma [Cyanobacteria bacter